MRLPRAITFTTDAHFRMWPEFNFIQGETLEGKEFWIWEAGWLKCKLDVYDLEAWNFVCLFTTNALKIYSAPAVLDKQDGVVERHDYSPHATSVDELTKEFD